MTRSYRIGREKVTITPKMIEAGIGALLSRATFSDSLDPTLYELLVSEVLEACLKAASEDRVSDHKNPSGGRPSTGDDRSNRPSS
jgi:hypothetical protein